MGRGKERDLSKKREKVMKELRALSHLHVPAEEQDKATKEKIKCAMESTKEHDTHLYEEDPSSANLVTRMYIKLGDVEKSNETNNDVRNKYERNITAKLLRIENLVLDNKLEFAKECLTELKEVVVDIDAKEPFAIFELCVHKADVAMFYYHVGPNYYVKAIELYEEAAVTLEDLKEKHNSIRADLVDKYLVIWRFKLLHLYNRMLNQENIMLFGKDKQLARVGIFHKVCCFVGQVLKSTYQHNTIRARAYIEVVDAHQKLRGDTSEQTQNFIRQAIGSPKLNDRWCIGRAQELAPDDGSVLEKAGRYYRVHAKTMQEFQNAETILKRCIDRYPTRHVALHHLALVYKSMWFEVNNFDEAKLHKNPVRNGQKSKARRGRRGGKRGGYSDAYSNLASAVKHQNRAPYNNSASGASSLLCKQHGTGASPEIACDDGFEDEGIDTESDNNVSNPLAVSPQLEVPNFASETLARDVSPVDFKKLKIRPSKPIKPSRQVSFDRVPSQFSKPDYFDILRTSNPITGPDTMENVYITDAIQLLERADEATKGTANKYLVDLARLYISNGELEKALACFRKAQENLDSTSHHERAYLYEQWALARDHSGATGPELDDIKNLYREAVASSVAAREKSKMAFYRLKDIIDIQVDDKPDNVGIRTEQALLQKMVENFDHAKGKLRDIFEENRENVELLWNLIEVLYKTEQYFEAFTYLQMVFPLQSPSEIKGHLVDEKSQIDPVSITLKAVQTIGSANFVSKDMLKSLFIGLTNSKESKEKLDNVLFYDDGSSCEYIRVLHEVFEECGLRVIDSVNNPELFLGKPPNVAYNDKTLKKSQCIVIIVDSLFEEHGANNDSSDDAITSVENASVSQTHTNERNCPEMQHLYTLEMEPDFRPILLTDNDLSAEWEKLKRLKTSPNVSIKELVEDKTDATKQLFMENFLRAVYDNIDLPEDDESDSDN